jgi:Tfp pilus assembly protein PilN
VLRELARQKDALDPAVRQVQSQEEEIAQLQKRLQALDEVTKKRVVPVLTNLSELLPQEFYLTHFRYKDGDIEVSGIGSKPASDLVATLEGSACLRNVAPKGPFTKTPQGETFTLGAQAEPCNGD